MSSRRFSYVPWLVCASVAVAVAASFAALWLAFNLRSGHSWRLAARRLGAAVVMGLAISGMHYLGMAASRFSAGAYCFGGIVIDNQWLAMMVGLVAISLLAIALIAAVFDAHLSIPNRGGGGQGARQRGAPAADLRRGAGDGRLLGPGGRLPLRQSGAFRARFGLNPEGVIEGRHIERRIARAHIWYADRRPRMAAALLGERQIFDHSYVDRRRGHATGRASTCRTFAMAR